MSSRQTKEMSTNKSIHKVIKLSRQYPKTAQNMTLLKLYLEKNGKQERKS